jgi:hypothetical protein
MPTSSPPRIFGLSRGQWLSAAMVAVGAAALPIVLTRAKRLNISPIAGWAKKA